MHTIDNCTCLGYAGAPLGTGTRCQLTYWLHLCRPALSVVLLFCWQFLFFVSAGATAERGKLPQAEFGAAI